MKEVGQRGEIGGFPKPISGSVLFFPLSLDLCYQDVVLSKCYSIIHADNILNLGNCKLTISSVHSFLRVVLVMMSVHSNKTVTKSCQFFVHFIKTLCLPVTEKERTIPLLYVKLIMCHSVLILKFIRLFTKNIYNLKRSN